MLFTQVLVGNFGKIFLFQSLDLDFDHVACSVLVLDVLGTSKAPEHSTLHHDTHLGGKSFSLVHTMSC